MTDYRNDPRITRLLSLRLTTGVQDPEHGGYAAYTGSSHCCVASNEAPFSSIGTVHAYCGPQGDQASADEALLFSLAPQMLGVLVQAQRLAQDPQRSGHEVGLLIDQIEAILKEITQ